MSFLVRSRHSQKWGRTGSIPAATSFSVRTGRRASGESDSVVLRSGNTQDQVRDGWGAAHFLRNETQAARAAVEALDKYSLKLASFQDQAMEVIEEAHRALSRLERAVAKDAAPELIVVACEIKVACHRGLHLFRTYGKYRYLGKVIALATRSSITAKFDAVVRRLTAIMPLDRTPSFTSIKQPQPAAAAAAAGALLQPSVEAAGGGGVQQQHLGSSAQRNSRDSFDDAASDANQLQQQLGAGSSGGFAAAAAARLKGSSSSGGGRGSADVPVGSITQCGHGAADRGDAGASSVLSVVLRSSEAARVTCISFVDTPGPSNCIWWAAGERLEFYSTATQSTTSFAPTAERAAVTAVAVDSLGNIWCANSKGTITMRQQRNWEQVFVDRAFSSCVRCLATDADSDVVWAGDEAGRLAVLRFVEEGGSCHLECTATILPGRAGAGLRANNSSALLDVRPKTVSRWQALSCRGFKEHQGAAEGPIRTMLVRDDRAWVGGGRTDPWIGLFDAVLGTQMDMWSCGSYGSCLCMASMLTSDALATTTAAAAAAAASGRTPYGRPSPADCAAGGLDVPSSVPEDHIGEDPRSSWRLVTGHESGQLLLWNAASDRLQPVVKVGDPGLSPVRALCVLEEQGLLAVVHANGDLALCLRPARDRDWLMGPTTTSTAAAAAAGAAADGVGAAAAAGGAPGLGSSGGSAAGEQQLALSAAAAGAGERGGKSGGGGGAAAAGLVTIKPRRVVLKSHRSMLVAAAACSSGVVTASALGSIKLWPAEGLVKEAERRGLLPSPLHVQAQRESSLSTRSVGSLNRLQQQGPQMARQQSDSLVSNARSPLEAQQASSSGLSAPAAAAEAAAVAAAAATMAAGHAGLAQQHPGQAGSYQQPGVLQQHLALQQGHQQEQAAALAWRQQQQHIHPQDSMVTPSQQLYGMPAYSLTQQQHHQQQQQDHPSHPSLARLSEPGVPWLQHQQQQPPLFSLSGAGGASGVLSEQLANPLVALERRSAPLDIPWQPGMVAQPAAAASAGRSGGMGTAMYARLTAQHQLGQLGASSPRYGGVLGDAAAAAGSVGAAGRVGSLPGGSFQGPPQGAAAAGAPSADVPMDSGPRYAAPRAPKALRDRELGMNRERRRSERRLSKGANIAWSTCQIIQASELRMLDCIGGGAYGQVFLAEWMGTQVAAKQLLSFQNKAKDEVTKRKAKAARAAQQQQDNSRDDDDSDDSGASDTDSVDSVEEEVQAELKQLMDEVWVLGSLSHPSITRFCALCLDPPMIVMQYYPHGSLFDLLKRGRRADRRALHELTWAKRLDMLRDIASGMVFLHSRKPPIVHGDLRSPNLLLDLTIDRDKPRFHVKIADFGLARMVGPTSSIAVSKVTNPRWSAPEVLRNSVVSLSADVFSFAVVMWEMLTWQQPYEDMMSVQVLFSVMQNFRPEIPPEDELPGKPGTTLPRYLALMERCWAEDEHARPGFEEVLAELDDLRQCELAQARLRGGQSQRSLHGSTRVSYSEAPGTPTGSCLGGSLPASAPGSNISSAPNSGRDGGGPMTLAAAAAANAAAASAAAAVAVGDRRGVVDPSEYPAAGARRPGRVPAASDPPTATGAGLPCNGGAAQPTRMQVVGGSAPTSGSSTSSSSRSSSSSAASLSGSSGVLLQGGAAASEPSFAVRPPPLMGGLGPAVGASAGPSSPGAPVRIPSRLGARCSSAVGSPTAAASGGPWRQDGEEAASGADGVAEAGGSPNQQRRKSAGSRPNSAGQQPPVQSGSRLRRLSWGTLEGSLQSASSGGSKQLGPQPLMPVWDSTAVHEYPPTAPVPAGPAVGGVGGAGAAVAAGASRPFSPFSAAQQGTPADAAGSAGGVSLQDASGGPFAAAVSQHAGVRSNPFGSPEAQQGLQEREDVSSHAAQAGAGLLRAPSPAAAAPARPTSPFAAVQAVPHAQDPAAAAAVAALPARPRSPFAAVQGPDAEDAAPVLKAPAQSPAASCGPSLGASRQGTDDSTAAPQPPARPSSPFAAVQEVDAEEAGAPVAMAAVSPRPASPFAAVQGFGAQEHVQQPVQPAAPAARLSSLPPQPVQPAAAAAAAAAAQQQQLLQDMGPGDLRVESLSGSPFTAAPQLLQSIDSTGGSSQGSCSAGGGAPVPPAAAAAAAAHKPSRLAAGAAARQADGSDAAAIRAAAQDPQALAGEQQWRPPSPFANVQAAAMQGPIVAQQARAVLTRLNSQGTSHHQGNPAPSQPAEGASTVAAAAAADASSSDRGVDVDGGPVVPRQSLSFVIHNQAASSGVVQQAHQRVAGAPGPASGSPQTSGDFMTSADSITFPSGLGAVESVVFMRGHGAAARQAGLQRPPQQ